AQPHPLAAVGRRAGTSGPGRRRSGGLGGDPWRPRSCRIQSLPDRGRKRPLALRGGLPRPESRPQRARRTLPPRPAELRRSVPRSGGRGEHVGGALIAAPFSLPLGVRFSSAAPACPREDRIMTHLAFICICSY